MVKNIFLALSAALTLSLGFDAQADNTVYSYLDDEDTSLYGCLRRLSPNGEWAAGGDEADETGSILLRTSNPEEYILDTDGIMLDVDDNGMAVGAWFEKTPGGAKYKRAAIYKDGGWERLPLPEQIIGQSYAVAISADSKTIAGHGMCANEDPDEPGKYFPMIWRLDEATGKYNLDKLYNSLYLPGTFGFFIEDMTPDGKYICGYQALDMSDHIAAMLNLETGEYTIWHDIEYKNYSFDFMGQTIYASGMFVDGLLDGFDEYTRFAGCFTYANDRYLFGSKATVLHADEDGYGEIANRAAVYDLQEGKFMESNEDIILMSGLNLQNAFTNTGQMYDNGSIEDVSNYVDTKLYIATIYDFDLEKGNLIGSHIAFTPWGTMYESPIFVKLGEPLFADVENIRVDNPEVSVMVEGAMLTVNGAKEVEVYAINGAIVSRSAKSTLAPGIYVVNAGGHTQKVIIK